MLFYNRKGSGTIKKKVKKPKIKSFKLKRSSKLLVGLDVGSHTIKIAVGQYKNHKIVLKKVCQIEMIDHSVKDGKLVEKRNAEEALANLVWHEKIKKKNFACTVESSEVIRREILLPWVNKKEIMGLITYEIGQYIPINPEAYIIQYKVLDSNAGENGQQMRLMVCAMPKNLALDYRDILQNLHLRAYALDTHTNALEKFMRLKSTKEFENKNLVFIDMGHSQFNISFFHHKDCLFSKKLDIGGYMLNEVLLANSEIGEKDAERLKISNMNKISIVKLSSACGTSERWSPEQADYREELVLRGMMNIIDRWADEINQVLKYTIRENGDIDEILLYGGCSFICDLDAYFQKRFNMKTRLMMINDSVTGKVDRAQIPVYLNAICALIRN